MSEYFIYKGNDPVFFNIHENLNKIRWILKNKKPFPFGKSFNEVMSDDQKKSVFDIFKDMFKSPFNL